MPCRGCRRSRYGSISGTVRWITAEHRQLDKF